MIRVHLKQKNQFHDKLFKLSWTSDAKWVWVHYRNSQTKPWYKRPGRSYRFKRWFVKKGNDQFKNLANYNSPYVVLYFVSPWLWTKRVVVHLSVSHLSIQQSNVTVEDFSAPSAPIVPNLAYRDFDSNAVHCSILSPVYEGRELSFDTNKISFDLESECNWPVSQWAEDWSELEPVFQLQKLNELK